VLVNPLGPVESAVRVARRRLVTQCFLNRLAVAWAGALAATLVWFLVEPLLFDAPPTWLRWAVLGTAVGLGTTFAIGRTWKAAPSRTAAALELDGRFGFAERATTALGLPASEWTSPAGRAVLADAAERVRSVAVAGKFPVRPRWNYAWVPVLAAGVAAVVTFPPDFIRDALAGEPGKTKKADVTKPIAKVDPAKKTAAPIVRPKGKDELDRADKDQKLKDIEAILKEFDEKQSKEPKETDPARLKEKITEYTSVEDKLKKFEQEKTEKLTRLEQKMQQLESLTKDKDFADGPAKDLADALAKRDLKKAQEDVDELRKKAKDKKIDEKESEKLDRQLDKMKKELERLAKNEEQEQKLKDRIEKAKKEGKDAESLERELEKMKQENKASAEAMEDLAKQLQKARNALQKGDMEELAQELEKVAGEMQKIEGELKDLEDAQEYLQRLKEAKEAACKACQGDGDPEKRGEKDFAQGRGIASGKRDENKDAKTASQDEKIRGLFDPRGKKVYGGSTKGQAFTKKTTLEMGKQIQEAVQEAPQAVDAQRLPRDARDTVKEYFESLGGSKKD
jgi:hypothetical protein